ncbi:MAG TPA: DUF4034 domain-containing protein [Pyrinomonadaceae bacterium]|nr:DUF4034 domain-containing protein [Pyrinomonadaceae bacterium]
MSTRSQNLIAVFTLTLCLFSSGCILNAVPGFRAKRAPLKVYGPLVPSLDANAATDIQAYEKYAAQIRIYLNQEKFDEIDAIADDVRSKQTRFAGGAWKLHKLYWGLREPTDARKAPDAVWQMHIKHLQNWVEKKPESITARVGLADAYLEFAWHARGYGFANTVTDEGWKLMHERVALAEEVLAEAKKLKAKCPQWYLMMQIVAKGQSWDLERYNPMFEEGIALEPTYHYLYSEKAQYLLPRWHGEEGDWERFTEETSNKLEGKLGSIVYYVVATDLACYYDDQEFFTQTNISWPKIKQSYVELEKVHGTSIKGLNDLCRIAGQAGDKAYTKELLQKIGDNWDPETWGTREYFEHYRAWAASGD